MTEQAWYVILAALIAATIPLVPKMVKLRIAVLRKLHLNALANWHEKYADGIAIWARLVMAGVVIVLLALAFGS